MAKSLPQFLLLYGLSSYLHFPIKNLSNVQKSCFAQPIDKCEIFFIFGKFETLILITEYVVLIKYNSFKILSVNFDKEIMHNILVVDYIPFT